MQSGKYGNILILLNRTAFLSFIVAVLTLVIGIIDTNCTLQSFVIVYPFNLKIIIMIDQ